MSDTKNQSKGNTQTIEKHTVSGLEIQIDDEVAQGIYSNGMMVNFNENEFTLDFLYVQPTHPKAKVRSRVIVTPGQIQRFLRLLQANVRRYDKKYKRKSGADGNRGPAAGRQGGPPLH